MHLKANSEAHGPPVTPVTFLMEDPVPLTGNNIDRLTHDAAIGESILELALEHGINIEHACGGVIACSTCHIYVEQGEELFDEATDDELDRVDEAPAVQLNSRLACQCRVRGKGEVVVTIPGWNRNAVKEVPH